MCWAHVQRAYSKRLSHIKNKELETSIDNDIHTLQLAFSSVLFKTEWDLLKEKYDLQIKKDKEVLLLGI